MKRYYGVKTVYTGFHFEWKRYPRKIKKQRKKIGLAITPFWDNINKILLVFCPIIKVISIIKDEQSRTNNGE